MLIIAVAAIAILLSQKPEDEKTALPPLRIEPAAKPVRAAPPPQCEPGGQEACITDEGCEGVRLCAGGRLGNCIIPKQKCVPGSKAGCTIDECTFGFRVCNKCGTGYLPCGQGAPANFLCNPK